MLFSAILNRARRKAPKGIHRVVCTFRWWAVFRWFCLSILPFWIRPIMGAVGGAVSVTAPATAVALPILPTKLGSVSVVTDL